MYIRVIHHFFKQFLAESKWDYSFIAISVPQIQNFRKFGPKLKLLQAKNKLKQPNTADRPILAAPQPNRAQLEQPQFWSDFSEILDLRSRKTFKTAVSFWLCLKKWWITLTYLPALLSSRYRTHSLTAKRWRNGQRIRVIIFIITFCAETSFDLHPILVCLTYLARLPKTVRVGTCRVVVVIHILFFFSFFNFRWI